MSQNHNQNCPLCNRPAQYCFADYNKRKHFYCEHCTEFQITDTAEGKLHTAPQQWRDELSAKAKKVGPDLVLSIFVPSGQRNEGVAHEAIRGEPTRREDLPPCR